ncbi:MAG TPA: 4-hydroxy-tetrahydrodipicolinate synthase [Candidatus Merdivicinus intestinigallinarum]|nr:4-hydroxy-tetrahydrodipicolinate synthase [Candidatus Merdivicinus intestinigallinarum]
MKKLIFQGAGIAILTPMFPDGSINWEEFGRLIDWQIDNSTDALIVCGTTGESPTLSVGEKVQLFRYAVERVNGRVPVIAGTGSNDTQKAIELSKEAKNAGADALLLVTPYYNKTSQRGLVAHYNAIADAVDLPQIVYHIPSRTGVTIAPKTFQELSKHPNIVAVKEASGNFAAIAQTRSLCGDELAFYSGEDGMIVPLLSLGGKGVISVLSHVAPKAVHDICALYFAGKVQESAAIQLDCMDLVQALFMDVNPIPVKEAVNMMGFAAGPCRMPLYPMAQADREVLAQVMRRHGLIS